MGNIGIVELAVIFSVALIVVGPRRLPELARQLARLLSNLRRLSGELLRAVSVAGSDTDNLGGNAPEEYVGSDSGTDDGTPA